MMATQSATTRKTTTLKVKKDAIKLLTDDHNKVKKIFKEFEELSKKSDAKGKEELVAQICKELTVHAQLEEEIFYPAVRAAINDDDLMNEAMVEHAKAKKSDMDLEKLGLEMAKRKEALMED